MLNICNEAARCLLCGDAACTAACSKGYDPAGMLRSIRFGNCRGCLEGGWDRMCFLRWCL